MVGVSRYAVVRRPRTAWCFGLFRLFNDDQDGYTAQRAVTWFPGTACSPFGVPPEEELTWLNATTNSKILDMLMIYNGFTLGFAPLRLPCEYFHTNRILYQLPAHPLYESVNWTRVGGGFFAVVDPMDDSAILYLSEKEYKIQVRVSVSQDSTLAVLARPGDTKVPDPAVKTTPSLSTDVSKPNKTPPVQYHDYSFFSWDSVPIGEFVYLVPCYRRPPAERVKTAISGGGHSIGKESRLKLREFGLNTRGRRPEWAALGWHHSRLDDYTISVNGELLVTLSPEKVISLFVSWGTDLNLRAGGQCEPRPARLEALKRLGEGFAKILATRGQNALVQKMKNTLFFVQRWLGGIQNDNPFLFSEPVGLARSGLPRIIPLYFPRE